MVMQGETLATGASDTCSECGTKVKLQVCFSNAGYYIGTMCKCGPYSRESGYYRTWQDAEHALKTNNFGR